MRMKRLMFVGLLAVTSTVAAEETIVGDVVVVTEASAPPTTGPGDVGRGSASGGLPGKGMTKSAVAREFGPPMKKHAPVGGGSRAQPPITRWDYESFSVFFEYNHVVDAVVLGNPEPIAVYDGLAGGPQ